MLARELALLGKRAEPKPGLHRGAELLASREDHALARDRRAHAVKPHPDRSHAAQIDRDIEIDLEARIDLAEIDALLGIDHQPVMPLRRGLARKGELDGAAA